MKIAFFVYPSAFQAPGGGEIVLLKTKQALEEKGIYVKLFNQWEDSLKEFDILHVFGSVKECLGLMLTARNLGTRVVLVPIFWSSFQRAWNEYGGLSKKLQMTLRHLVKVVFPIMPSARRKMMVSADAVTVNSMAEVKQVSRLFCIDKRKIHIVYLAADERFSRADSLEFIDKYDIKDFVLSVGRIEPRKNQLNLIKAMKGSGKKAVFIGDPVPGYEKYHKACLDEADKDTLFIGRVDHESSLLSSAYAASGVFVLQGWLETPGLVALEAGLAGARLAVTQVGSTREYFKDHAEYFNPASPKSIREAIDRAVKRDKDDRLKKYILNYFLWPKAADENIIVYNKLIGK
ncbi:MAG: glycosyltransferase [Candidatus Omnitrophota bacterium]